MWTTPSAPPESARCTAAVRRALSGGAEGVVHMNADRRDDPR